MGKERQYPRIELNSDAYNALQAEMLLTDESAREIASKAILGYVSSDAIDVMRKKTARQINHRTIEPLDDQTIELCEIKKPDSQETTYEECGAPQHSEPKPKRIQLSKDPALMARILELSAQGMKSPAISKETGVGESTIRQFLSKRREEQPGI